MLALTLVLTSDHEVELLDDHIRYHLSAGADVIVVGAHEASTDHVRRRLGTYDARAVTVEPIAGLDALAGLDHLRRLAIERGAEWIIESDATEFWWPRTESLKAVLDPIPGRYTTVQALVRVFLPNAGDGESLVDRMTVRSSLLHNDAPRVPLASALRPINRVRGNETIDARDLRYVPLRAWYPIEVFRFPARDADPADGNVAAGLADGTLVEDFRLRDYLRALREGRDLAPFTMPTIVDEASHAIECAAIGEVDLAGLDRHIRELEDRIANLEQRFWPRVVRRLSRGTRSGGS